MNPNSRRLLASLAAAAACATGLAAQTADPVEYPADFRSWTFIKKGPSPARGGVHHIYANERAMTGIVTAARSPTARSWCSRSSRPASATARPSRASAS